jgi:lysozyme family protein
MADFYQAIPVVLANEGGYVDDPDDPGGATNFGISQRRYPDLDIKNLTKEEATAIYLRDFWLFGGLRYQPVATKLFDAYVNMEHEAIKQMQKCLGFTGSDIDGDYGKITEAAINDMADQDSLLQDFRNKLVIYYEDVVQAHPEEAKFLPDWLRRARQ